MEGIDLSVRTEIKSTSGKLNKRVGKMQGKGHVVTVGHINAEVGNESEHRW